MLLAASIPLSKFATSVCMFSIFGSWLLSPWNGRFDLLKSHWKSIVAMTGLFLVFAIGLWNTENTAYALKDLQIKLPLLFMPLALLTGPQFESKQVLNVFGFLSVGAFVSAFIGYSHYLYISNDNPENFRAMSPFISHIRLSLMLCFSLIFYYYLLLKIKSNLKWLLVLPCGFILFFLSEIQSLTALVVLPVILCATLLFFPPWRQSKKLGRIIGGGFLVVILILSYKVQEFYQEEFKTAELPVKLPGRTINGAPYIHDITNLLTENGNRVGLFYCEEELKREWKKASNFSIDSMVNGYPLEVPLCRFLTSRNYTKDSLGVSKLTPTEIKAIEKGMGNHRFLDGKGIETRVRTTLWEIKRWKDNKSDYQSSVTMRIFIWENARIIMKNNLWTGVGQGDVEDELRKQYSKTIKVDPNKMKRTHNQYFTVAIAVGFVGLLVFVFLFLYPFAMYDGPFKYLYIMGGLILFLSMLWEDTIETQAGVALFGLLIHVPFAQYLREKQSGKS